MVPPRLIERQLGPLTADELATLALRASQSMRWKFAVGAVPDEFCAKALSASTWSVGLRRRGLLQNTMYDITVTLGADRTQFVACRKRYWLFNFVLPWVLAGLTAVFLTGGLLTHDASSLVLAGMSAGAGALSVYAGRLIFGEWQYVLDYIDRFWPAQGETI